MVQLPLPNFNSSVCPSQPVWIFSSVCLSVWLPLSVLQVHILCRVAPHYLFVFLHLYLSRSLTLFFISCLSVL